MIYFLLILWILYCGLFYNYPKFRSISIWLIVVVLTLVMGLRGSDVGVDTAHYEQLFNSISHQSFFILFKDFYYEALEPGWVLINKLVSTFGGNYFILQFIVSSFICGLYGYVLIKESRNSYISIIVFLPIIYLISFNIQRQMLACAILFCAWHSFICKKYRITFLILIIASSIHITSLIFVYSLFLALIKDKKYFVWIVICSAIGLITSYLFIIDYLGEILPKYHNYYTNSKDVQTAGFVKIVWIIELLLSIFILIRKEKVDKYDKCIAGLSIICVSSFYIGLNFNYFERVGLVFAPFLLLLFPIVGNSLNKNVRIIYNSTIISCFLIWFFLSAKSGQYVYSTWL